MYIIFGHSLQFNKFAVNSNWLNPNYIIQVKSINKILKSSKHENYFLYGRYIKEAKLATLYFMICYIYRV